ncbi:MAG: amino acid ABC transporter substrate-binding protein [Rhodobacter sp.]|nr:amino acid ABC transporter substrate-binding protein [Rhodobacter sp.]MCA3513657.1 amino acid ABC transporter substrate-binding protein [Rhodobacter sp.]MCA3520971.1 amino acid ABC transporter substrate-binding protein [Rhodobacter sp.]MCA3522387.1 amino acid ABC transporter substrate-binding protein [Rhodobacter sp.]MCA3525861.1 amino acid ABC transporter substrate-binding protein [Rhodobacter sp.]
MKKSLFFGTLAAAGALAGFASADTLADIKARGELLCGTNTGLTGFAAPDANGVYQGFDVAVCKAIAAAVLGDATKVRYVPTTGETRFTALASGEVDLLVRNSTWTFSRDTDLKFDFVAVNYYDGQGFMVKKDLGVSSAKELDGATVCIQTGTTTELNLADFFKANNISYTPVTVADDSEAQRQYVAGACDAYTTDASGLAATRATLPDAENHIILPEIISKEPLGPVVRHGDNNWGDIVRWTFYALVAAEELGITSANVNEIGTSTVNPEIKRILGTEGDMGAMMGLDAEWAKRAIAANGNYGEIFAANIGESTPIGLARGLNAQWTQGGLMYAPPFR